MVEEVAIKLDYLNKWHYSVLVLIVGAIVFTSAMGIWTHSNLGIGVPLEFKIVSSLFVYFVSCWFFIAHRPR